MFACVWSDTFKFIHAAMVELPNNWKRAQYSLTRMHIYHMTLIYYGYIYIKIVTTLCTVIVCMDCLIRLKITFICIFLIIHKGTLEGYIRNNSGR